MHAITCTSCTVLLVCKNKLPHLRAHRCTADAACTATPMCCSCFFAGLHRGDLRRKYNLPEEPLHDCLLHL